ncbi:MAG: glycosyltransferase family 4 protein [Flavobacteriales bacterium]|nr:glycosyltransferase family 4 protein [Flavobacteriales bacterium]
MKILFLTPYPHAAAPSQRFRFEQYYEALKAQNIQFEYKAFWSDNAWNILYKKGNIAGKLLRLINGWLKRFLLVFRLDKFDYVFVHREIDPLGLRIFPWLYGVVARKKIIFDFDDAIWIPNASESNRAFMKFKNWNNTRNLCRYAYKVSAGNAFLCNYAREVNPNVVYNPTTIDTVNLHNRIKNQDTETFVIGWTGTHSTIKYLEDILPVMEKLAAEIPLVLAVICDKKPSFQQPFVRFIPWNKATEIDDLLQFNIGLMPLTEDKWSQGKCGFKALQYMALGIPALVSPVGVNSNIVNHGINGFICSAPEDWITYIRKLYNDRNVLKSLSAETRKKIEADYSVTSNTANFIRLFS